MKCKTTKYDGTMVVPAELNAKNPAIAGLQYYLDKPYLGKFFEYLAGLALKRVTARVLLK